MTSSTASNFSVKFPSRRERTVKRVTKCETREIQKRLEPPKPVRVRPPPKPRAPKKSKQRPPATLSKPAKPPSNASSHSNTRPTTSNSSKQQSVTTSRILQASDLEKLARLNCSREFGLFHQYIKSELSKSYENQLAFLQTKLEHVKNGFENKQAEHLNFEQIKSYYNQALKDHVRRNIKPDEYLTLAEKFRQDTKEAIDKWLRKKDIKPPRQINEHLLRRQERVRNKVKETIAEQKRQRELARKAENNTDSCIITTPTTKTTTTTVQDDDIIIID